MSFTLSYAQIRPDPCPALDCWRHAPGRQLAALAWASYGRPQHRKEPAVHVERDRKRRLEAAAAGLQRIDADHLERPIFLNVATERATARSSCGPSIGTSRRSPGSGRSPAANRIGNKQNMSSPSPVTDGRHVWVMTGTGILKAFDFAGKELWTRDIPKDHGAFGLQFGYASSPLLHDDALVSAGAARLLHRRPVVRDEDRHDDRQDRLADRASDQRDARVAGLVHDAGAAAVRRQDRDRHHRRRSRHRARSRDRARSCGAPTSSTRTRARNYRIISSPLIAGGLIIAPTPGQPARRAPPRRQRRYLETHVAWTFHRGPDVPSPVSDGKYLYLVSEQGVVYCLELRPARWSTARAPPERLLQLLAGAGRRQDLRHRRDHRGHDRLPRRPEVRDPGVEHLRRSVRARIACASVAVSQGQLFVKTDAHLWVVGERRK